MLENRPTTSGRVFAQRKVMVNPPRTADRVSFQPVKPARVQLRENTAQTSAALAAKYQEAIFGPPRSMSRPRSEAPLAPVSPPSVPVNTPASSTPQPPPVARGQSPYRTSQTEQLERRLKALPSTSQRIARLVEDAANLPPLSNFEPIELLSPALQQAATAVGGPQRGHSSANLSQSPRPDASPASRSVTPPRLDDGVMRPPHAHPLLPSGALRGSVALAQLQAAQSPHSAMVAANAAVTQRHGPSASRLLSQYVSRVDGTKATTGGPSHSATATPRNPAPLGVQSPGSLGGGTGGGADERVCPTCSTPRRGGGYVTSSYGASHNATGTPATTMSDHTPIPAHADPSNPALSEIAAFHVGAATVTDLQRVVREQQAMLKVFFDRISSKDAQITDLNIAAQQLRMKVATLRDELADTDTAKAAVEAQLAETEGRLTDVTKEQASFAAAVETAVEKRLQTLSTTDSRMWSNGRSIQRELAAKDEMIRQLHNDLVRWRAKAMDNARTAAGVRAFNAHDDGTSTVFRHDDGGGGGGGGNAAVGNVSPFGRLAIVFTDIQGSTELWDFNQDWMASAQFLHDAAVRALILQHGGYEVKTVGDAFMVAFQSVERAVGFALAVQDGLLQVEWPATRGRLGDLTKHLDVETINGEKLWCGLRVRVGVHVGEPLLQANPKTGRMDYYGPAVNTAARVESAASGGYVMLSSAVVNDLESGGTSLDALGAAWRVEEDVVLKGVTGGPHTLYCCVPRALARRLEQLPARVDGKLVGSDMSPANVLVSSSDIPPPSGWCAIVHMYVSPHYNELRADASVSSVLDAAAEALLHDACSRLGDFRGFLVSARDGALSVVFHTCTSALHWALDVQMAAMEAEVPPQLLSHPLTAPALFRGQAVLRGLCPAVGVVLAEMEPTARGGYNNPALDDAAELARAARPGEILAAQAAFRAIKDDLRLLRQPSCKTHGPVTMGGASVTVSSIIPAEYGFRRMVPPYRGSGGGAFTRPLLTMTTLNESVPARDVATIASQMQASIAAALRTRRHAQLDQALSAFECAMMSVHDRDDEDERRALEDPDGPDHDSVAGVPTVYGKAASAGGLVEDQVTVTLNVAELLLAVHNSVVALHSLANTPTEAPATHAEALEALYLTHRTVRGFADLLRVGVLRPAESGALPLTDDEFQRRFLESLPPSESQETRKAAGTQAVSVRARRREVWHETVAYAVESEVMETRIANAPIKLRRSVAGLLARLYAQVKTVARKAAAGGHTAPIGPPMGARRSIVDDDVSLISPMSSASQTQLSGVGAGRERAGSARGVAPARRSSVRSTRDYG